MTLGAQEDEVAAADLGAAQNVGTTLPNSTTCSGASVHAINN